MAATTDLAGRVALVTGGARGLGNHIAHALAGQGASVVLGDVLRAEGEAAASALAETGAQAWFEPLDVSKEDDWTQVRDRIAARSGRLDILVNNAGIYLRKNIARTGAAEWDRILAVNLTGPFLGTKVLAPLMRDGGGGAIVNISSIAGLTGHPDPSYCATKWGLRGLTKTAALEFADWGIRVNTVHPGSVPTPLQRTAPPRQMETWELIVPMRRIAAEEDISAAVLYLVGDGARYVTGTEMIVDGGLTQSGLFTARERLMAAPQ